MAAAVAVWRTWACFRGIEVQCSKHIAFQRILPRPASEPTLSADKNTVRADIKQGQREPERKERGRDNF